VIGKVVVVGASGNVGVALLRALRERPDVERIVGVARRPPQPGSDVGAGGKISWHAADVVSDDLEPAFAGADAVVNLAWQIQPARARGQMHLTNVHGSRRIFDATLASGARALVHASSVGVYAPGPKHERVSENWPHTGIASSSYSRDKATVEAMLDRLEAARPELRIVRPRPALIFQRQAGVEIARYFLGPFVPRSTVRPRWLPAIPLPKDLRFQVVHTSDVAEAYVAALAKDVRGAFNLAAEPVLDAARLAQIFHARQANAPLRLIRALADASYRLRLQPTDAGWVDLAARTPLMDTTRARTELNWSPRRAADDALIDLTEGIQEKAAGPTPVLR
jgi:nucleoside-diphosphate-sugar epimerase